MALKITKTKKLKESEELDRELFTSLVKLGDKPYDGYSILNDGYFVKRIYAESDDDAVKQFRAWVDNGGMKNESCGKKLKEGRWNYKLESGVALRNAIDDGDYQGIINAIKACYQEMLDKGIIDEYDFEYHTEDLDFLDVDDEDGADEIDYALDQLYDFCDEARCWIAINESCKGECNEDADVTDQVIIKLNEPGFIGKKHELQDKGYEVIGTGDGVIIMAKPKPVESCGRKKSHKKMTEAPIYDLSPRYDSRKSFYNKAKVDTGDKNDQNKLYSYNTLVAEIKDGKPVVYGTYSATTLRHIKDWLKQNGFKAETAKQIMADYGVVDESCKRESIGKDVSEYQKWVDYDMKKYHKISKDTMDKIKGAGLSVVKDQYGDYEVIADRPVKESRERDIEIRKDRDKTRRLRREIRADKRHLRDDDDYIKGDKKRNKFGDDDISEDEIPLF